MAEQLFVYGTLHPDQAPPEIRDVVRRMKRVTKGTVIGTLHQFGDYPGLVLEGNHRVPGTLFELPNDPDAWQKLDAYEEYLPSAPESSLFVRKKRVVTMGDGKRQQHWVYVYNRPLSNETTGENLSQI